MSSEKFNYSPTNALNEARKRACSYYTPNNQSSLKDVFNCNWWTIVFANMQLVVEENKSPEIKRVYLTEFRDLAYEIWRNPNHQMVEGEVKAGLSLLTEFLHTPEDNTKLLR